MATNGESPQQPDDVLLDGLYDNLEIIGYGVFVTSSIAN